MIAAAEGLTQASGTDISQLQPWAQNLATISKGRTIGIHMGALGIAYNSEIMAEKGVAPPPSGKTWQSPSMLVKFRSPTQILRALPYTELATITQLFGQD